MKPAFDFGQHVRVIRNVRNDGTFPGRPIGQLLLRRGATGYVRDVGSFLQDEIIYSVDFIEYGYRVGCREQELIDAEAPWTQNRYEFRDHVTLKSTISVKGQVVAEKGAGGEIGKVVRDNASQVQYHLAINGRTLLVPEDLLEGESDLDRRVNEAIEQGFDPLASAQGATLPWKAY